MFMTTILSIKVQRMGGAFAGIMGTSGADNDILNKLKRTALAFAKEYTSSEPNQLKTTKLSQEMYGYFQTLQLTYTITEKEATSLIDELDVLNSDLT
jgi:hypothetical protein